MSIAFSLYRGLDLSEVCIIAEVWSFVPGLHLLIVHETTAWILLEQVFKMCSWTKGLNDREEIPEKITVTKMLINTYEFHGKEKMVVQVSGKIFKDSLDKKRGS